MFQAKRPSRSVVDPCGASLLARGDEVIDKLARLHTNRLACLRPCGTFLPFAALHHHGSCWR